MEAKISKPLKIAYACGSMGYSVLTNLIIVMITYFYLPPSDAGIPVLIPQVTWFGVINLLTICISAGRLFDAVYDPFLANWSDASKNKRGRRIPFMLYSILPACLFCCLAFFPPLHHVSGNNALWLMVILILFFISTTTYIIPYNALLPELARTSREKVQLAVYQQVGFVLGIITSALCNNIAGAIQNLTRWDYTQCVQVTVIILASFSFILLLIPVLFINEKTYCHSQPTHLPLWPSLKAAFSNKNFRFYLVADFSFFVALSIISTGLLYYLTVLANRDRAEGATMMGVMVLGSLFIYPFINPVLKMISKKVMVFGALLLLGINFLSIYYLGRLSIDPAKQLYILVTITAIPVAILGVVPMAILADIASADAAETGENKEAMYYAVKFFFVKLGQTVGTAIFAMLTLSGIEKQHDLGLRLNGIAGFVLCTVAAFVFLGFRQVTNQENSEGNKVELHSQN